MMNPKNPTATFNMSGDGIYLPPHAYGRLLADLTDCGDTAVDYYSEGGVVSTFEQKAAAILGKEDALILPSGTMANLLALGILGGQGTRVLVQHDSHIHRDSGDAIQSLGGMNLIPLAPGRLPVVADLKAALAMGREEKVPVPVRVLHLESPVRRLHEAVFDLNEFDRLVAFGRAEGMGLHLDGARLFIWSAWCGRSPADLAAPFETVYVSLYKYFNTLSGAVLAGRGETIGRLRHQRRRNGGALAQIWPVALMADYFMDGFMDRLISAKQAAGEVFDGLKALPGGKITSVAQGTNAALLAFEGVDASRGADLREKLMTSAIRLPQFSEPDGGYWIKINESWACMPPEKVVAAFAKAL